MDLEQIAARALEALTRFETTNADADLAAGIDGLSYATVTEPDHPAAPEWHYFLGLARAARALNAIDPRAADTEDDWNAAVDHLRRALDGMGGYPEDEAEVLSELALVLFRRFHGLIAGWDDDDRIRRECVALGDEVDDLDAGIPYVTMIRGLIRLDAYLLEADPIDRDEGIALLATALPELDIEATLVAEAFGDYALALDGVPNEVEGRELRRDRAIEAVANALSAIAVDERPELVLLGAELRCARGDNADDPDELRIGAEGLAQFRAVAGADASDLGYSWHMEAVAHERLWYLTKDPAEATAVVACCDGVLAVDPLGDPALDAHRMVMVMVVARLHDADGRLRDPTALPAARARFEAAVEVLDARPDAAAGDRAELAMEIALLGTTLFSATPGVVDLPGLRRFADLAQRHPEPPAEWDTKLSLLSLLRVMPGHEPPSPGARALPEIAVAWPKSAVAEELSRWFAPLAAVMAFFDAFRSGDRARIRAARELLAQLPDDSGPPMRRIFLAMIDGMILQQDGATDEENIRAIEKVAAAAEADSDGSVSDQYVVSFYRSLVAALRGEPLPIVAPLTASDDPSAKYLNELFDAFRSIPGVLAHEHDPDGLRATLLLDVERSRSYEPGTPSHMLSRVTLSAGYLQLARIDGTDPGAAEAAVHWGRKALDAIDGPHNPLWAERALGLGEACRLRAQPGDLALSREAGLSALRGHAWQALFQSGTDHAVAAVRTATETALTVADWCVTDRAEPDLLAALESGRGLALHAATTTRSVAGLLAELGRADLAAEWTTAGAHDPISLPGVDPGVELYGDLRQRVMSVLVAGRPEVLAPPDPARIRAVLRSLAQDALVYLVAGDEGRVGRAVVVPAVEDIEVLDLPGLDVGPGSVPASYAAAYEAWHFPAPGRSSSEAVAAFDAWSAALERLGEWAWGAAGADVLTTVRRLCQDRVPRVVLVPVGMLGLVPWHAAARPSGTGVRYLVEDAVVSYTASAHLLCDVVERAPVAAGSAVIVGNPTNNLRAAGIEAQAVRAAFHPHATYLGRTGAGSQPADRPVASDGPGSPAEVLDHISDPSRPCSLLHLACHARADATSPSESHLRLHDGAPLTVGALMERSPTEPLPLGTVVLAACSTSVAGRRYDEAFSIATAFLAAGARSAVGSIWTVPDGFTSRLVFMLHHHLHDGLPPADAVRAAQLWMLDRYRDPPVTMPDALLATPLGRGVYEHPVNWAGLTHLGR